MSSYFNGMIEKATIESIENGFLVGITVFSEHGECLPAKYFAPDYEAALALIGDFSRRKQDDS